MLAGFLQKNFPTDSLLSCQHSKESSKLASLHLCYKVRRACIKAAMLRPPPQ